MTSPYPKKSIPPYATLRAQKGLAAHQVAKLLGISISRYIRIEQGLTQPTPDELHRLDDFYK